MGGDSPSQQEPDEFYCPECGEQDVRVEGEKRVEYEIRQAAVMAGARPTDIRKFIRDQTKATGEERRLDLEKIRTTVRKMEAK